MTLRTGIWFCAGLLLAAPAEALTTKTRIHSVETAEASERWNARLDVPRFDPRLGTLRSVTFRLTTHVGGTVRVENLNAAPLSLTQTLCVVFELRRPNFSTLLQATPLSRSVEPLGAYDGVTDFGGASGRTRTHATATGQTEWTAANPNDLLLFTGSGVVGLPLLARPKSSGVGVGNYAQHVTTRSRAALTVVYTYEAAPVAVEPVSWSGIKLLHR